MARKRQIDPGMWVSEQFIALPHSARLLFIGMISQADDEGRLRGSAQSLKASIFPCDDCTSAEVQTWRDAIVTARIVQLYKADGTEYLFLPTFTKWQYMTKRFPSRLPVPPLVDNQSLTGEQPEQKPVSSPKEAKLGTVNNKLITATQPVNKGLHGIGDGGGDGIGSGNGNGFVPTGTALPLDERLAKANSLWEDNMGPLTGIIAEKIEDAITQYGIVAFEKAITKKVLQKGKGVVPWNYFKTILDNNNEVKPRAKAPPDARELLKQEQLNARA